MYVSAEDTAFDKYLKYLVSILFSPCDTEALTPQTSKRTASAIPRTRAVHRHEGVLELCAMVLNKNTPLGGRREVEGGEHGKAH